MEEQKHSDTFQNCLLRNRPSSLKAQYFCCIYFWTPAWQCLSCLSSGLLQDLPKATRVMQGLHRPQNPSGTQQPAPGRGDKTKGEVPSPDPTTNTPWPWGRRVKARLEYPSQVESLSAHGWLRGSFQHKSSCDSIPVSAECIWQEGSAPVWSHQKLGPNPTAAKTRTQSTFGCWAEMAAREQKGISAVLIAHGKSLTGPQPWKKRKIEL